MKYQTDNKIKKQLAFSIVELMIAILIGIIILTGLISVFDTSQKMSRTQNGLARIQENGRYAITKLKEEIATAGYAYCIAEDEDTEGIAIIPTKLAWDVRSLNFIPGIPTQNVGGFTVFDPGYMLFGHECTGGTCTPALNAPGSDLSANVPAVGVGDGQRIEGTDVLTIRYLEGGREVDTLDGPSGTVTISNWSAANSAATSNPSSGEVLIMSCKDTSPWIGTIVANSPGSITVSDPLPAAESPLIYAYNFQRDFKTITYYVANNVVDGRSIPTLYSSENGVINPIVEGVDAFDVVYGVKDNANFKAYVTADQVDSMATALCWPAPKLKNETQDTSMTNVTGCGWRSVGTINVHMLLNTIYNSSNFDANGNEPFRYSQYGNAEYNQSDLPSVIPHYSMHRKEFFTSISLKNIIH